MTHIAKYLAPRECCYLCGKWCYDYTKVKDEWMGKVTICKECEKKQKNTNQKGKQNGKQ